VSSLPSPFRPAAPTGGLADLADSQDAVIRTAGQQAEVFSVPQMIVKQQSGSGSSPECIFS